MANLTDEEVVHVAKLSNLDLTQEEVSKFRKQLGSVIDFIRKLQEVNTEKVQPTSQTTGLIKILRNDKIVPSFKIDDVFYSTERRFNDYFKTEMLLAERGEK